MGFEELVGVNFWTALFVLLNTLAIFFVAKKYLTARPRPPGPTPRPLRPSTGSG